MLTATMKNLSRRRRREADWQEKPGLYWYVCKQTLLERGLTNYQGIHNIFIVIPQFVITGISSIIFAVTSGDGEEERVPGDLSTNSTAIDLDSREGVIRGGGPNSYAYVFR